MVELCLERIDSKANSRPNGFMLQTLHTPFSQSQSWTLKLFFTILFLFLSACSNLNVQIPDPMVESPVVWKSQGSFGVALGGRSGHSYEFSGDASQRPPDLDHPEILSASAFFGGLNYSLIDRLQVGLNIYPFSGGAEPGVKWQFLGENGAGPQMSVSGSFGYYQTSKSGNQNGEFGPGGYNWEGKARGSSSRIGLSMGYFISPNALVYAGGSVASLHVSADIDHSANSDNTSPAASYSVTDSGSAWSAGGGLEFGTGAKILMGYTFTQIKYDKIASENKSQWQLGLVF